MGYCDGPSSIENEKFHTKFIQEIIHGNLEFISAKRKCVDIVSYLTLQCQLYKYVPLCFVNVVNGMQIENND